MRKWKILVIVFIVVCSMVGAAYWYFNSRFHLLSWHEVIVSDFEAVGSILDIGGGGEGIIGRLKGDQVVAIDISKRELEESPPGPLKIVMDARDLQFLDGAFDTATAFFTLMYINGHDHEKVFQEVLRVLAPGGRFMIWDVALPMRTEGTGDTIVIPLTIKLPNEEIKTAYGTGWPEKVQDLKYYIGLAETVGFRVGEAQEQNQTFFLMLIKP